MIALNLDTIDSVCGKTIYFSQARPKSDAQSVIKEINPTVLSKWHFYYMTQAELDEMDKLVADAIKDGFDNLKTFDEFKNEL